MTDDKIKLFTFNDESLKILGELLSNETSRKIINSLIENEMYTNELSVKLDIPISLVGHHLRKLEQVNLVEVTEKPLVKKGVKHKHFRMIPNLFVGLNTSENNDNKIKNIFKKGMKFASIGIVSLGYYLFTKPPEVSDDFLTLASQKEPNLTYPLLIILVGLIIERIFTEIKKKGWIRFNRK